MAPVIEKLAQEFEDQIELVKIDADKPENEVLLRLYDIRSIPTLVLARGDVSYGLSVGQASESSLREWIKITLENVDSASKVS